MAISSPYRAVLSAEERSVLTARARSGRTAQRDVSRARIVLAAAEGDTNAQIARGMGTCCDTVGKWRARFCAEGLDGLRDRPRPGRRRIFPKTAEAEAKAMACALPAETGVPLSRWSTAELAAEAVARGVVNTISPSTVGRWLRADATPQAEAQSHKSPAPVAAAWPPVPASTAVCQGRWSAARRRRPRRRRV